MFVSWARKGVKGKGTGVPGKLLALEPVLQNLHILQHNLKHHDMTNKVSLVPHYTSYVTVMSRVQALYVVVLRCKSKHN